MKRTNKIIITVILISVLLLGIGYAAIKNITLNIKGTVTADPSQANFNVRFSKQTEVSDATKVSAKVTDDLINAEIDVTGLTTKGESVTATYTVENASENLSTNLSVETTNDNEEYFTIKSTLGKTSLVAKETTTLTVEVELIKTPIEASETATIGIQLIAEPVQPGEEGSSNNEPTEDENVTSGGLKGSVSVGTGLQISLDAKTWRNEIDFGAFTENAEGKLVSDTYTPGATLDTPYEGGTNILPDELLPVSTTGTECIDTSEEIDMYWGENVDMQVLKQGTVKRMNEEVASGYYAIDFFLQNASASGVTTDKLQLEPNSVLNLLSSTEETGLQNAVRVALALYDNTNDDNVTVNNLPTSTQILEGTSGQKIKDVAIWEPNANAHVQYIVDSNNDITWNAADAVSVFGEGTAAGKKQFITTTQMPTYALTSASITKAASADIADIYDWSDTGVAAGGLAKQYTLQTPSTGVAAATQLVSAKDGSSEFSITSGQYHKVRMYIWLESQDVDSVSDDSIDGIELDIGFSKAN